MQPGSDSETSVKCRKVSAEHMSLHSDELSGEATDKSSAVVKARQGTPKKLNALAIFLPSTDRLSVPNKIARFFFTTKRAV
jgi:hypothetical protein